MGKWYVDNFGAESGPTLRVGSRGEDVKRWQRIIGVTDDGNFGPKTKAATQAWQKDHGLVADGVVGPKTWGAVPELVSTAAVVPPAAVTPVASPAPQSFVTQQFPVSSPAAVLPEIQVVAPVSRPKPAFVAPIEKPLEVTTIRRGSRGDSVKRWQTVLGLTPDGNFGPATEAATKQWQASHGLTPDGVVGPKTWAAVLGSQPAAKTVTEAKAKGVAPLANVVKPAGKAITRAKTWVHKEEQKPGFFAWVIGGVVVVIGGIAYALSGKKTTV